MGYEATRVNDLVEISGVSSRSFYDLFADKEACFVATLKEVLKRLRASGETPIHVSSQQAMFEMPSSELGNEQGLPSDDET